MGVFIRFLKKAVRTAFAVVGAIALFIVIALAACITPYLLAQVNEYLNKIFRSDVSIADYLNYIAAFFTGILAVAISVIALRISRREDRRERRRLEAELDVSKRVVIEHVSRVCSRFHDVRRGLTSYDVFAPEEFPPLDMAHPMRLRAHGVIDDHDLEIVQSLQSYVERALSHRGSGGDDLSVAEDFCGEHLRPPHDALNYCDEISHLMNKLS